MDDHSILVETRTKVHHLEADMDEMKEERKEASFEIRSELTKLGNRIGALEKHHWIAVGALAVLQFFFQWFFKSH